VTDEVDGNQQGDEVGMGSNEEIVAAMYASFSTGDVPAVDIAVDEADGEAAA
jgi:hypothetical protein